MDARLEQGARDRAVGVVRLDEGEPGRGALVDGLERVPPLGLRPQRFPHCLVPRVLVLPSLGDDLEGPGLAARKQPPWDREGARADEAGAVVIALAQDRDAAAR